MARAIDNLSKEVIEDLAELSMKLAANAKTRKPFLNAVKEVDPSRRFPSQEVEDLREEMKAEREREKEERKLEEERRATEKRLSDQRNALIGKGYTDDQLKEVEEIMTKHGFADYGVADELYRARKPAAAPEEKTGTWTFPTLDGLIDDPAKAARNEAFKVITELKRGRAA